MSKITDLTQVRGYGTSLITLRYVRGDRERVVRMLSQELALAESIRSRVNRISINLEQITQI